MFQTEFLTKAITNEYDRRLGTILRWNQDLKQKMGSCSTSEEIEAIQKEFLSSNKDQKNLKIYYGECMLLLHKVNHLGTLSAHSEIEELIKEVDIDQESYRFMLSALINEHTSEESRILRQPVTASPRLNQRFMDLQENYMKIMGLLDQIARAYNYTSR